jgi:SAM-dependent methyltransferase
MNFEEIKTYWDQRASGDSSVQSTTQDVYLREIEFRALRQELNRLAPSSVADVGCGDGRTTIRLAGEFPSVKFFGFDYSPAMIENAKVVLKSGAIDNVTFAQHDICELLPGSYGAVYTTRCLINLPEWDLQKRALRNIHQCLAVGGVYLMIENFIEGHNNFNRVRAEYGLPEIKVRDHNLFFERERLGGFVEDLFEIEREVNISSAYYLASRVLYSKICEEKHESPNYYDDHHRLAVALPFVGEYGPVRLLVLRKS